METKELTIIDQVKEVEAKSGVSLEIDITEVVKLAERGRAIESVEDPNFAVVKKEMQQARKTISEYMLGARAEFNRMAKGVIEVEKAVLAEFTGEEERLKALDKAEKERQVREARLEALPTKRERITTAGIEFTDEDILALTDADFEIEYNRRLGEKLEADRIAAEEKRKAEEAKLEAERAEIQRQKDEAARIEAAREEERKRAEEALRIQKETAEREAREAEERRKAEDEERRLRIEREEREAKEKAEREAREAEEAKKRELEAAAKAEADRLANQKYLLFLEINKYNKDTDIIQTTDNGATQIYRFVAEFKPE